MLKKIYSLLEKFEDALSIIPFGGKKQIGSALEFSSRPWKSLSFDRLILVTLDTLRSDHLGCYGYPRKISPCLDAIAQNGILFEQTYASMSTTVPAHASIFTSLYPIQHNVLKNGHRLNKDFVTMAEILRMKGYCTAGFVSTDRHFHAGNLDKGFDLFNEPSRYNRAYRKAKFTVDKAVKWLKKRTVRDRFFLWVHLFDPHVPYKTPLWACAPIKKENATKKERIFKHLQEVHHVDFEYCKNHKKELMNIIDLYDAEIFYMDRHLGRLFGTVQGLDLEENTLWIITSDHGEGLGNHGWMGHNNLYQDQVLVPLIFYLPYCAGGGKRVTEVVEHVDILPTVMELIGSGIDYQYKPVQGKSLVSLWEKDDGKFDKLHAFLQGRDYVPRERSKAAALDWKRDPQEEGERYALVLGDYKYIWRTRGKNEFFCIKKDPYEINNLFGKELDKVMEMQGRLQEMVAIFKEKVDSEPESVDAQTIERLKDLGYYQ